MKKELLIDVTWAFGALILGIVLLTLNNLMGYFINWIFLLFYVVLLVIGTQILKYRKVLFGIGLGFIILSLIAIFFILFVDSIRIMPEFLILSIGSILIWLGLCAIGMLFLTYLKNKKKK